MAAVQRKGNLEWEQLKDKVSDLSRKKPADEIKKKIPLPTHVPIGNKLAHFIRSIHWNSKGMLPSSAGSKRSYDKYNTVTHLSFAGPDGFELDDGLEPAGGFERKRETVEDVLMDPKKNQMFNRWNIPERFTTPRSRTPGTPKTQPIPEDVEVASNVSEAPAEEPEVARSPSPKVNGMVSPTNNIARQASLPNIRLRDTPTPRVESRNGLQSTTPTLRTPRTGSRAQVQRSKTMVVGDRPRAPDANKGTLNGLQLSSALRPEAVPQAETWMRNADKADKKVIQKILKMASKTNVLQDSLKKTLLPDAKDSVEKWMDDANEEERQVALDFFGSLAGGQLMGMTIDHQRKRLQAVLNTLEDGKPGASFYGSKPKPSRRKNTISDGKLRYLRLLTPHTRENRWMQTTWHHLPEYRDNNIVGNWSSHYVRPQGAVPRHFVIHPDWG